jgi:hypothetical protein
MVPVISTPFPQLILLCGVIEVEINPPECSATLHEFIVGFNRADFRARLGIDRRDQGALLPLARTGMRHWRYVERQVQFLGRKKKGELEPR